MYAGASLTSKALSRLHERLALTEISVRLEGSSMSCLDLP